MPDLAPLASSALATAAGYARQALAPATLRAYSADWQHFTEWCEVARLPPLPASPETVAAYLGSMARTHSRATIRRRLAAIGHAHQWRNLPWPATHPIIGNTLRGMFRQHGAPPRKAAAIGTVEIRRLVATCDGGPAGLRDRALLLLGFAGALRRSELVAVEREHLAFVAEGIRLTVPRGKGDQEGEGAEIGIPRGARCETCPVRALEAWLAASDCQYGPVFRKVNAWGGIERTALRPNAVRVLLQKRAGLAGLTVGTLKTLSPHGLRAGFVTEAYKAGARDEQIMGHTRHRDIRTMRGYVRRAKLMAENPAKLVGL